MPKPCSQSPSLQFWLPLPPVSWFDTRHPPTYLDGRLSITLENNDQRPVPRHDYQRSHELGGRATHPRPLRIKLRVQHQSALLRSRHTRVHGHRIRAHSSIQQSQDLEGGTRLERCSRITMDSTPSPIVEIPRRYSPKCLCALASGAWLRTCFRVQSARNRWRLR